MPYIFKHDAPKESEPTCDVRRAIIETPEISSRNYIALTSVILITRKVLKETWAANAAPNNHFN